MVINEKILRKYIEEAKKELIRKNLVRPLNEAYVEKNKYSKLLQYLGNAYKNKEDAELGQFKDDKNYTIDKLDGFNSMFKVRYQQIKGDKGKYYFNVAAPDKNGNFYYVFKNWLENEFKSYNGYLIVRDNGGVFFMDKNFKICNVDGSTKKRYKNFYNAYDCDITCFLMENEIGRINFVASFGDENLVTVGDENGYEYVSYTPSANNNNLFLVTKKMIENILDVDRDEYLFKNPFKRILNFQKYGNSTYAVDNNNNKYIVYDNGDVNNFQEEVDIRVNNIKENGELNDSFEWIQKTDIENLYVVRLGTLFNYINTNGELLNENWFTWAGESSYNGAFTVYLVNGSQKFLTTDGRLIDEIVKNDQENNNDNQGTDYQNDQEQDNQGQNDQEQDDQQQDDQGNNFINQDGNQSMGGTDNSVQNGNNNHFDYYKLNKGRSGDSYKAIAGASNKKNISFEIFSNYEKQFMQLFTNNTEKDNIIIKLSNYINEVDESVVIDFYKESSLVYVFNVVGNLYESMTVGIRSNNDTNNDENSNTDEVPDLDYKAQITPDEIEEKEQKFYYDGIEIDQNYVKELNKKIRFRNIARRGPINRTSSDTSVLPLSDDQIKKYQSQDYKEYKNFIIKSLQILLNFN